MSDPLRVLILEDRQPDVELILDQLRMPESIPSTST